MKKIGLVIVAVILLILGAGYYINKKNPVAAESSTIFSPPQAITEFSLIDTEGRPFNNHSLWGQWTFLFFGFTSCKQTCPTIMNNLNQFYKILLQQKQNPLPKIVLISVDPEHDSLKKLGNYVQSFNPGFQGATGDKTQLDKLAASLNVLNDRSGVIILLDPSGKLIATFSPPHNPQGLAKDFQLIVQNSG